MKIERAKGVRDFGPEEKIVRDELVNKIVKVFENYGFSPLETPSFERYETLSAKFGAGATSDAMKEIFMFEDQGSRKLGLRFDLTLPMSRFIAMNPHISLPFKRYEIGRVFRDGPIKLGRYREFWQCDVDTVGVKGMEADAELIMLSLDVFDALGLDAFIEVNNRKILNGILDAVGIKKFHEEVLIILDKLSKIGLAGVEKELWTLGVKKELTKELTDIFDLRGTEQEILEQLKSVIKSEEGIEGVEEMEQLLKILKMTDVDRERVKLNISLARGLSYYTGTVFEGFLKSNKISSSICGGGRYDRMIGLFSKGNDYPAVGISFGIEPIVEFMKLNNAKMKKSVTKVFVIPIKTFKESLGIVQMLRKNSINTEIDLLQRGVSKNLNYVNNKGIPFVLFIGEEELKSKKVKLKDMDSGTEKLLDFGEIISKLKE